MFKFQKLLPALALVLGATLAMAMNFAENPTERYALDPDPLINIWYDLTDVDPGNDTYDCNTLVSATCSHVDPMITADQVEPGQFVKNGPLPPAIP